MAGSAERTWGLGSVVALFVAAAPVAVGSIWGITSIGWDGAERLILLPSAVASGAAIGLAGAAFIVRSSFDRLLALASWSLLIGLSWLIAMGTLVGLSLLILGAGSD